MPTDRLDRLEAKADRILEMLTNIWNQQQVQKHAPEPSKKQIHPRIIEIAQAIVERHPASKTLLLGTASEILADLVSTMLNPIAVAESIGRHHAWRCRYEWVKKDPAFVPKLFKWLKEDALSPCPSNEEGQAMLRQPERMSRIERDLLDMQKEFGG
jgi:hypothetical protein